MNTNDQTAPVVTNPVVDQTTAIVSAYVSNNPVSADGLMKLITDVAGVVRSLYSPLPPTIVAEELKPAVPVKKSVMPDGIICLEDGKKFKSLKRHLRTGFNLSPDQYREKWGLPADYPMVAPAYSAQRSQLAKTIGLGRKPNHVN